MVILPITSFFILQCSILKDTCTNIVLTGNVLWQWPIILKDVCNRSHMNKKRNKIIALQNPNPEADYNSNHTDVEVGYVVLYE